MSLSNLVRREWNNFEEWLAGPRAAAAKRRAVLVKSLEHEMDRVKRTTPDIFYAMREEYEANKKEIIRVLEEELVLLARLEWEKRLKNAGLRAEDWTDMSFPEMQAVEEALGGELDEEQSSTTGDSTEDVTEPMTSTTTTRQPANSTEGYAFVNPTTFGEEEHEDGTSFESLFPVDDVSISHHCLGGLTK